MAANNQNKRDDFTSDTVTKLGKRVGFLCSNPDCRILTVGPNEVSDRTTNIGKAAHITAASPNGPRYDPDLTSEQRKSIDNGIWLCGNCHDKVDADAVRYPAELLRQWKKDAEDAASNRLGKPVDTANKNARQFPLQARVSVSDGFLPNSRDAELAVLEKCLREEGKVFLWGFGGIGKSETAIKLALQLQSKDEVFLLHYQNSMHDTILKLNFEGYKHFPTADTFEANTEADYRQRMKMLHEGYRDSILIVDNFDVEGKSFDELVSEAAYQDLCAGSYKLIFTTRYPVNRPEWEIKPLTPEYGMRLMRNLAPEIPATDAELMELIEAVDGHTLTIILMARTLSKSWDDVSPAQMLDALKNSRWKDLHSPDVLIHKDREKTQRRIEAHLTALFDLSRLSDDAKIVLACATLLPDGGMDAATFRACLTPEQKEAVNALEEGNWLTRKGGLLTIHPVMRQVCRISQKPNDTVCGAFLEELWKQYDISDYNMPKKRQMAECFAVATDSLESKDPWYPIHAGHLFSCVGQNDSVYEYCQKAAALAEQYHPDDNVLLGTVWNDLGYAYNTRGNYQMGLAYHEKALHARIEALPSHDLDLIKSYENVGITHSRMGNHAAALELKLKACRLRQKSLPESHPDLIRTYDNIAIEYDIMGDSKNALSNSQKALELHLRFHPNDELALSRYYDHIGSIFHHASDPRSALRYAQMALDIRLRLLPDGHPAIGKSCHNTGLAYLKLHQYQNALKCLLSAKSIFEKSFPVGHPELTTLYQNLARVYGRTFKIAESRKYRRLAEENKAKEQK